LSAAAITGIVSVAVCCGAAAAFRGGLRAVSARFGGGAEQTAVRLRVPVVLTYSLLLALLPLSLLALLASSEPRQTL